MNIISNYIKVSKEISNIPSSKKSELIVVSKNFTLEYLRPILDMGHIHFGENRVNEAISKWSNELKKNLNIQLHLIGKLQSNKIKNVVEFFSYIHSLDSKKLATLCDEQEKKNQKKLKYFIQVNIGSESQKSGVDINELDGLIDFCRSKTNLDIVGLMCIPPLSENPIQYFEKLKILAINHNLKELSMGMSNDFNSAIQSGSTFVRIGSAILGNRIS
jgi:pyridoxal phosphate enzyme (YggS family)